MNDIVRCFLVVCVVFLPLGCAKNEDKEIKIGAILPLSGDGASYGKNTQKGIELYLASEQFKKLNKKVKIIYEDTQLIPKNAVNAFNKLGDSNIAAVMGPFTSSEMLAIAPIADQRKVVVVSSTATAPAITQAGDYVFRIIPSDVYDGKVVAHIIKKYIGKQMPISLIYINNDYGLGIKNAFLDEAKKIGLQVGYEDSFNQGTTDFRALLQKLKKIDSQVMFLIGYKEMGRFLRQSYELGLNQKVVSTGLMEDPEIIKIAGKAANGILYSYPAFNPQSGRQNVQIFIKQFRDAYHNEPDIIAALGYDLIAVLIDAIQRSPQSSSQNIRNALYSIKDFPGLAGDISFDNNGDVVKEFAVKKVEDGKFVWVNEQFKY